MIHHLVAASALTGNVLLSAHTTNAAKNPKAARRPAAAARDGSHHHDGNGHHNRNIISVRSPTHNRGYQHTNNSNAGGTNPVQNALCRQVTVCTITQKVNIIQPPAPAAPVPAAPVQALVEPVVPQRMVEPQVRPVQRPVERPLRGPFMYLGSDGFFLMAPDSSAPATFGSSTASGFHLPMGFFG
jgi:hypothetical protein